MSLHLVTGHSGKAHITAADQGALNACMFGTHDYVLNSGNNFAASVITNNQVRIADGELMMQGRHVRLAKGTYEDVVIENGTQGMNRNDLIVVRYTKNTDSSIEVTELAVIKGTETTGTAVDPEYTTGDILSGDVLHEMPLYRIPLTGLNVGTPVLLFKTVQESGEALENLGGLSKTLLWSNTSPSSDFLPQTVLEDVDLSEYDEIEIEYHKYTAYNDKYSRHCKVGTSIDLVGVMGSTSSQVGSLYVCFRTAYTTANGVRFAKGLASSGGAAWVDNNKCIIPIRIYGIKGVQ